MHTSQRDDRGFLGHRVEENFKIQSYFPIEVTSEGSELGTQEWKEYSGS